MSSLDPDPSGAWRVLFWCAMIFLALMCCICGGVVFGWL